MLQTPGGRTVAIDEMWHQGGIMYGTCGTMYGIMYGTSTPHVASCMAPCTPHVAPCTPHVWHHVFSACFRRVAPCGSMYGSMDGSMYGTSTPQYGTMYAAVWHQYGSSMAAVILLKWRTCYLPFFIDRLGWTHITALFWIWHQVRLEFKFDYGRN